MSSVMFEQLRHRIRDYLAYRSARRRKALRPGYVWSGTHAAFPDQVVAVLDPGTAAEQWLVLPPLQAVVVGQQVSAWGVEVIERGTPNHQPQPPNSALRIERDRGVYLDS